MITIKPTGEYKHGFTIEGHAGYAELGKDIVCASVSVLAQTVGRELEKEGLGRYESSPGFLTCTVWADDGAYATKLIGMMLDTFRLIEQEYPGHVSVQ